MTWSRSGATAFTTVGLSTAAEGYGFTAAEHADVVDVFIASLVLDGFTHAMQDWGGPIGVAATSRHVARARAMVLGNTWAWPNDTVQAKVFSGVLTHLLHAPATRCARPSSTGGDRTDPSPGDGTTVPHDPRRACLRQRRSPDPPHSSYRWRADHDTVVARRRLVTRTRKDHAMETIILEDEHAIARLAAGAIVELLATKPDAVLGLATGSSPLGVYDELAARHDDGDVSFARARAFTLDEYVGLPADHPERYHNVIDRDFTVLLDDAAASRLQLADYFRESYRGKPSWQGL